MLKCDDDQYPEYRVIRIVKEAHGFKIAVMHDMDPETENKSKRICVALPQRPLTYLIGSTSS